MTVMTPTPGLDPELVYGLLAEAIDRIGPEQETLFLTRLALLLGCQMPDAARLTAVVEAAEDLAEA